MAAPPGVTHALKALKIKLSQVGRAGRAFNFEPDEAARGEMAKALGLVALASFEAMVVAQPWNDGVEIKISWRGAVVQTCGLTLEDFETPLSGVFGVHALPPGSPHIPEMDSEVDIDPDADDPPDVLEDDSLDLGAYVLEALNLAIDPFPRKPGASFDAPDSGGVISPFDVLRDLKT